MEWLEHLGGLLREHASLLATAAGVALALAGVHALFRLRERRRGASALPRHVVMLVATAVGGVAIVLALPIGEGLKGQLLGLLGLALTAVVAFSSTTFVANVMAGLMLRAVGDFRPGDWIQVGDVFGRVTERGLFHVEVQTEDRDLATLPNLYLTTHPVKVVSASGTVVGTTLSLGYDLAHGRIEALLVEAAQAAELEDPFVHVLDLGDFSVTYRVAGFLGDVRHLLTARSRLRAAVLDGLHAAGVEIVSPTYMNQRRLAEDARVIPPAAVRPPAEAPALPAEEIIFDKAEERASLDELARERERLLGEIAEREKAGDEDGQAAHELERLRARTQAIERLLDREARAGEEPPGSEPRG